jgi:high-affinity iron transporter
MAALALPSPASAQTTPMQTAWRLLDYIAVDYPEAIQNGQVVNQTEFAEMLEFSATPSKLIGELPASAAKDALSRQAADLEKIIATKVASSTAHGNH